MFEQIGTVIIVIVVLVVGAGLGLVAGFVLGRHKGQEMARGVKSEELEEAKTSLENARFENAELSARNAAAQAQIEGVNQQLAFAKSQLAQAQQAEQIRIQRERERAAAEAERKRQADAQAAEAKRAEQEARLKEQSKVLEALAPVAKNLDTLQVGSCGHEQACCPTGRFVHAVSGIGPLARIMTNRLRRTVSGAGFPVAGDVTGTARHRRFPAGSGGIALFRPGSRPCRRARSEAG